MRAPRRSARVWPSGPFLCGHDSTATAAPTPGPRSRSRLRHRPLSRTPVAGCFVRGHGWCARAGPRLRRDRLNPPRLASGGAAQPTGRVEKVGGRGRDPGTLRGLWRHSGSSGLPLVLLGGDAAQVASSRRGGCSESTVPRGERTQRRQPSAGGVPGQGVAAGERGGPRGWWGCGVAGTLPPPQREGRGQEGRPGATRSLDTDSRTGSCLKLWTDSTAWTRARPSPEPHYLPTFTGIHSCRGS